METFSALAEISGIPATAALVFWSLQRMFRVFLDHRFRIKVLEKTPDGQLVSMIAALRGKESPEDE